MTELDDEKVRKDDILSNRDKSNRLPEHDLDRFGVQVDEYKDISTNQRPEKDGATEAELHEPIVSEKVDRPGFDIGGVEDDATAGKGLGLGSDAMEGRDGWGLPR